MQRRLFGTQLAVSGARGSQLFVLGDLYKALGGSWDPTTAPTPEE
ncbi:hypothetical protein [Halioglobus sp. HI00S01]|nr:hypothetical protein [Halioglobus sp. HI00S01]